MKTRIISVCLSMACCLSAVGLPQQKPAKAKLGAPQFKNEQSVLLQKAAAAHRAPAAGEVYVEDFESEDCEWKFTQSPGLDPRFGWDGVGIVSSSEAVPGWQGGIPAASGNYFVYGTYVSETEPTDHWAISPAIALEAGEYWVSAFVYTMNSSGSGNEAFIIGYADEDTPDKLKANPIVDNTGENFVEYDDWNLVKVKVTINEAGDYYFGWNHVSEQGYAGYAAFDYFRITKEEPQNPKPNISGISVYPHICAWDYANEEFVIWNNDSVSYFYMEANVTFADSIEWEIVGAKMYSQNKIYNAIDSIVANEVQIKVTAFNEVGDSTFVATLPIARGCGESERVMCNLNDYNDEWYNTLYLYSYNGGSILSEGEAVSVAESFDYLAVDDSISVDSVRFFVYESYLEDMSEETFRVRILGYDEDGNPDDAQVFGTYEASFAEAFGAEGAYIENPNIENPNYVTIKFEKPVQVKGPHFVVLDFPEFDGEQYSAENNYVSLFACSRGYSPYSYNYINSFYPSSAYIQFSGSYGGYWYSYYDLLGLLWQNAKNPADQTDSVTLGILEYIHKSEGSVGVKEVVIDNSVFAENGRVYANGVFSIYDLLGRDVTRLNGNLEGVYVVKTAAGVAKVNVRK